MSCTILDTQLCAPYKSPSDFSSPERVLGGGKVLQNITGITILASGSSVAIVWESWTEVPFT
ncbi:hypothetical protein PQX77_019408, partial [Marasmius sp. AFHP31]